MNNIILLKKNKERMKFLLPTMRNPVIEMSISLDSHMGRVSIFNRGNYSIEYYFEGTEKECRQLREELLALRKANFSS